METTLIQSQQVNPKVTEEQNCSPSSSNPQTHSYSNPQYDSDEINLLEYIYVLVKSKWWITGVTVLGLVLGYVSAIIIGPSYVAEAVIAAKESSNSSPSSALSSLGMLGGMVASQLNISQNPGLDKIDQILDSKKFNAELIEKYNLLPEIYKQSWPKEYKKWYDTTRNVWRDSFQTPNLLSVGASIKGKYLKKELKNGVMTISIQSKDSTFTDTLISKYLNYLNFYIKTTVQSEAKENVSYLENQLVTIADPLLREKLQNMIASEMEKAMVVSNEAFKIVDPQLRSQVFKAKKLYPIAFGGVLFFMTSIVFLLLHALSNTSKTDEDKLILENIRRGLFLPVNNSGKPQK